MPRSIVPAGFICDHIEVLYDLDTEAAAICAELGVPMVRARAVNDHPPFLDMMADVVGRTVSRYKLARPISLVLGSTRSRYCPRLDGSANDCEPIPVPCFYILNKITAASACENSSLHSTAFRSSQVLLGSREVYRHEERTTCTGRDRIGDRHWR